MRGGWQWSCSRSTRLLNFLLTAIMYTEVQIAARQQGYFNLQAESVHGSAGVDGEQATQCVYTGAAMYNRYPLPVSPCPSSIPPPSLCAFPLFAAHYRPSIRPNIVKPHTKACPQLQHTLAQRCMHRSGMPLPSNRTTACPQPGSCSPKDACTVEAGHRVLSHLLGLSLNALRDTSWRLRDVAYAVLVHRLNHRVRHGGAVPAANDHDSELLYKRRPLFRVESLVIAAQGGHASRQVIDGLHDVVATAVVCKPGPKGAGGRRGVMVDIGSVIPWYTGPA